MFWWYYRSSYRVEDPNKPWPIVLWLQGGPGASGVGTGNFQEVGPLDTNLKPRNSTWLRKADLLFVDNPVGAGYSFVEDNKLFVKTDVEAATDLTTLLIEIFNRNQSLQQSPLYIVAESYGGKFAVTLALSAHKAIQSGKLKLKLGGVALGDSWISPEDFVDFYNFLLDSGMDPLSLTSSELSKSIGMKRYSRYLQSSRINPGGDDDLDNLMNGVIRKKLKIIPQNISWGGQSDSVFSVLKGDFMKPRIDEVDELLAKGVNVTVYNGQLDLICATKGTEAWVQKLK
ncbi:Serine carboxypeptidase-like 51 [Capsicum baccatum]|uniref:Carboxypeptidase n=1 Tax=Capsicum baccatum TaxID=33114 RepID=A0A2G2VQ27_CAPBA|nr:Serine carboxypeptidase-like 51 [Capsicum baccatum]